DQGPAHVCKVTINVSACGGTVTADPPVRHVPRGTYVIQWELGSGYEFADNGIEFKPGVPSGVFARGTKSGNKFQWVDNNTAAGGPYPYSVRVLKNGQACASYDPEVSND